MWSCLLMLVGLLALVGGAELLVRGASRVAETLGISPLVIGLTVVAFGTSAPEMAVSVAATRNGQADLAIGNVVGSNIFNVLLILGLSALVTPLRVDQKLVRFDVPLMILLSAATWILGCDGTISRLEGGFLFAGLVAYTVWCIISGRRENAKVLEEYQQAFGSHQPAKKAISPSPQWRIQAQQYLLISIGLTLLVFGAGWFVDGATALARSFGISELAIGLTIVAAGTSLPELATSMVAAIRGERDIAVGNVVGSNMFNVLGVLGLGAIAGTGGIPVASQALEFDLPVMIAVAASCLPIFFTGHQISRWEGGLFVGYYMVYTVTLLMLATEGMAHPLFRTAMLGFVLPLTATTLCIFAMRSFRDKAMSVNK